MFIASLVGDIVRVSIDCDSILMIRNNLNAILNAR